MSNEQKELEDLGFKLISENHDLKQKLSVAIRALEEVKKISESYLDLQQIRRHCIEEVNKTLKQIGENQMSDKTIQELNYIIAELRESNRKAEQKLSIAEDALKEIVETKIPKFGKPGEAPIARGICLSPEIAEEALEKIGEL